MEIKTTDFDVIVNTLMKTKEEIVKMIEKNIKSIRLAEKLVREEIEKENKEIVTEEEIVIKDWTTIYEVVLMFLEKHSGITIQRLSFLIQRVRPEATNKTISSTVSKQIKKGLIKREREQGVKRLYFVKEQTTKLRRRPGY